MVKQTFSHNHTQRNTCPIQWRWPWSRKMPWNIGELQDINGMTFIKSTLLIVSTKRKHVCGKILMGPVSMSWQSFKMGFLILVRWHLKTLRCTPDGTKPLLDLNMTCYQWLCFVFIFNVLLIKDSWQNCHHFQIVLLLLYSPKIHPSSAGPASMCMSVWHTNLVTTVDVLAPKSSRSLAGTVLTTKLVILSSIFHRLWWFLITSWSPYDHSKLPVLKLKHPCSSCPSEAACHNTVHRIPSSLHYRLSNFLLHRPWWICVYGDSNRG